MERDLRKIASIIPEKPEKMPEPEIPDECGLYVSLFEAWTDAILNGGAPDCRRFKDSFMKYWGDLLKSDKAQYCFLFYGFVAGLDCVNYLEQLPDVTG